MQITPGKTYENFTRLAGMSTGNPWVGYNFCGCRKNPRIAQKKVHRGTANDRDSIGEENRKAKLLDEGSHQDKISAHRDQSVCEVEPDQRPEERVRAAIAPGITDVPDEVVQQRDFKGGGCSEQIATMHRPVENAERPKLHDSPDDADEVEPQPPHQAAHGRGSSR